MPLHRTLLIIFTILVCGLGSRELSAKDESAKRIKGLQVQMLDDAIDLGIHHATLNINLSHLDDLGKADFSEKDFSPSQRRYLSEIRQQIKKLTDAEIRVYLILLAYPLPKGSKQPTVLDPRHDPELQFNVGAMNAANEAGREHLRRLLQAFFSQLNKLGPLPIEGLIVGNEVNSSKPWNNLGRTDLSEAVESYVRNVRDVYSAAQPIYPKTKIYISLDHFWEQDMHEGRLPQEFFSGKAFLSKFAARMKQQGDLPWHLAYHPYPENLFNPQFWNDQSAWMEENSPRITFKNLSVLCDFMKRDELRYQGAWRSIIFSEQGLHSEDSPAGHENQAAAFVYAWEQVKAQAQVDAFIYHRHVDHRDEGGLNLGLWTRQPDSILTPKLQKPIYQLFKAAETEAWEKVNKESRNHLHLFMKPVAKSP